MHVAKCVTRGRKNIGSTWSENTCLFPLAATQILLLQYPKGYGRSQRLNNNDWKQAIEATNKTVH
jgi:hypothetical protein